MSRSVIVALALCATAGTAPAQDDAKKEAKKFFRAGESAYNAGDYIMAAEAFEQAYASLPLPAIAFTDAQAYRLQYFIDKDPRRLKRAIGLYRVYIEEVKTGGRRDDAVTNLAELEPILLGLEAEAGQVEAMGASAPATKIMVSSNVKTARAAVDGAKAVTLPLVSEVSPGTYKVIVSAEGYFSKEQEYTVVEGQFRVVEVMLQPRPATVRVRAISGAQIMVDGRPAGTTPLSRALELPAGQHFITVTHRGRHAWSKEIHVERGETIELSPQLSRTFQRKVSYVVLGAGATAAVLGGVTALGAAAADGDASELDTRRRESGPLSPEELMTLQEKVDDRDDLLQATYVFLGVGGALAATGALLYFMDNPRPEAYEPGAPTPSDPAPVAVTPMVGRDVAGLAVTWGF